MMPKGLSPPIERAWRNWRYAFQVFRLEAADCREMLQLAREVSRREDACHLIREGWERLLNALRELELAYGDLLGELDAAHQNGETTLDALVREFRAKAARWGALLEE